MSKLEAFAAGLLCGAFLMVGIIIISVVEQPEPTKVHTHMKARIPLPQKCTKYLHEYTEADWNPVTESYPPNHEWMDCMGVGYK